MIDACRSAGVLLLYAEELFFAPKVREGESSWPTKVRSRRVHLVKQGESRITDAATLRECVS